MPHKKRAFWYTVAGGVFPEAICGQRANNAIACKQAIVANNRDKFFIDFFNLDFFNAQYWGKYTTGITEISNFWSKKMLGGGVN
jgi:hypothetical protein